MICHQTPAGLPQIGFVLHICPRPTPLGRCPTRCRRELGLFCTIAPSLTCRPPDVPSCPSLALFCAIGPPVPVGLFEIGFVLHVCLAPLRPRPPPGVAEIGFVLHNRLSSLKYRPTQPQPGNWVRFARSVPLAPAFPPQIGFVLHLLPIGALPRPGQLGFVLHDWLCLHGQPRTRPVRSAELASFRTNGPWLRLKS